MQTLTFRPALFCVLLASSLLAGPAASAVKVVKQDYQIDSVDPGIKLFVRSKMAEGTKAFTNDNIVLFVHGATFPSTPDFDLQFKDYSWADWMVQQGYVVYMFDKRNYGLSSREKAMEMPPAANPPGSRSYLVIRGIRAEGDHIPATHKAQKEESVRWGLRAKSARDHTSP